MAANTDVNTNNKINIISLDLGTKNLIVRVNGQTVFEQPSAIVFDRENGQVFIGNEAALMKDKVPANKIYKEPMANGVISDIDALIAFLCEIFVNIVKVNDKNTWRDGSIWENSVALVATPSKVYKLDKTVLRETLEGKHVPKIPSFTEKYPNKYKDIANVLRAEKVVIVPEVKLAAIGAGTPIWDATGVFILDIGGGTSDCAILSAGDVIVQDTRAVAGNALDAAVQKHFETMHYLSVSQQEAEKAKIAAGLWVDAGANSEHQITVYGKSTKNHQPETIVVPKKEVALTLTKAFEPIIQLCKDIIKEAGPSFSRTLQQRGLIITGGGALLENITDLLRRELKIDHIAIGNDPKKAVIKGTESYEVHKSDLYEKGYIRPSK